jgi:hypothetical protein
MSEYVSADPNCMLCAGTGELDPGQSRGIAKTGPCLCVASAERDKQRQAEREAWKAIVKEAVLEAFHEVAKE